MKVIGKTEDGFILEASKNEISNFIGYYWPGETGYPQINIGANINAHKMYQYLKEIKAAEKDIITYAEKLRLASDLLRNIVLPVDIVKTEVERN